MKLPIYLDYASTTPLDPLVEKKMRNYFTIKGIFGNSSSRSHQFGWSAEEAVNTSRYEISKLIHADPREIIFTSGATESNNLAIKGITSFYKKKGNHIITCKTEHKSVLDTCRYLETKNFKVTYLTPKKNGLIDIEELKKKITKKTILISIMHVNNEIGVIQDIKKISKVCISKNIFFHVDATQSVGKISVNIKKLKVDLLSFSAHKIYGPKGIGVLYVKRKPRIRLNPQIHGGGHERGMRSGTLPVHQIIGMSEACKIARKNKKKDFLKIKKLRNTLWKGLSKIKEISLNSNLNLKIGVPHILNISFNYIEGESLIMSLKNIGISSGSACTSESLEPSYVLKALGLKDELAHSSIRFSIGKFTSIKEINFTIKLIKKSVKKLRNLSPLWEMFKQGIDLNKVNWKE
ncbi:MAG: IscS subfamily cysteine desulfurase [Buchnera aphidicola (Periphyllus lyropictus)]|uniref:IscS subfamily cysteine desulfurase n=1 Tax=Buchnera aphidicola TaxID=9 RepID=UPI001EB36974|nr:IscS subfamily cysteine desulfurase [Buchnera aphidicola]NIH16835.1 IscS subfamily cysteine desulfurase [Buchnera aphidicola (Periphyllus lyropictus)]USS94706.1 IscS subfamily cysteine desulfurase [Buchnera aphidicola (Periphyllus lyropictus)]